MFFKIGILVSIFVVILSGCVIADKNISNNHQLSKGEGIAVLSLTSSGECGFALFAEFRGVTLEQKGNFGMQSMFEKKEWNRNGSDCSKESKAFEGVLRTVALPEGIYEIHKLSGINKYESFSSVADFSIQFTVTRESVTYLGNLHFVIEDNTFDYYLVDRTERDLSIFERDYPHLKGPYIIDILQNIEQ